MIPNLLKFAFFINLLLTSALQAQEIWHESFAVPEKGIRGDGNGKIISDLSGIQWTLEFSGVELVDADDYAKTVSTSGGRFEVRNVNGTVKWISEKINIENFKNVKIQLSASETGSNTSVEQKFIRVFYRQDDGSEIPFEINGNNAGNWGSAVAEQNNLEGKNLEIIVYLANLYASDRVILDEVAVTGEEIPEPVNVGDVLISEVLFNPNTGGTDYVEIYNNLKNPVALKRLYLASRDSKLELTQIYQITSSRRMLNADEYLVLATDSAAVFLFYPENCPGNYQKMSKFPSFNNDMDYVVLLNEKMEILDELYYTEKMHSPLLADKKGVALERISFSKPAGDPKNWHSASSLSGYGTPGCKNSQSETGPAGKPNVWFEPEAFSPNFDGYNDDYLIHFEPDKPRYIANATVFDANGRFVLKLAQNEILGISSKIRWNGENETGQLQTPGVYVVLVEVFDLQGNVFRFKDGVVLTLPQK